MTLTEQEIEFFKEAKRIQEEWEPKFGDRICDPEDGNRMGILTHPLNGAKWQAYWLYAKRLLFAYIETVTWLPRQRQLQEMLEERECDIQTYILVLDQSEHRVKASIWPKKGDLIETFGPTLSIALGRALIEMMDKEAK